MLSRAKNYKMRFFKAFSLLYGHYRHNSSIFDYSTDYRDGFISFARERNQFIIDILSAMTFRPTASDLRP